MRASSYAGLLMAAQIVLTELLLGVFSAFLTLPALLTVNLGTSGGLLVWLGSGPSFPGR